MSKRMLLALYGHATDAVVEFRSTGEVEAVLVGRDTWEQMGSPMQVTVTIEAPATEPGVLTCPADPPGHYAHFWIGDQGKTWLCRGDRPGEWEWREGTGYVWANAEPSSNLIVPIQTRQEDSHMGGSRANENECPCGHAQAQHPECGCVTPCGQIERLENPTGTRCPVRDGDRRCLGDAAHTAHYFLPLDDEPNASVPAVTDDEAAKKVLALEFHRSFCGSGTGCRVVDPQGTRCAGLDSEDFRAANGVLSGLRSAGFLIVHHTKET